MLYPDSAALFADPPDITDYFPVSGPSQGGSKVTVLGSMPYIPFRSMSAGWTQLGYHQKARGTVNVTTPLIRFSAHTTREVTDVIGYGDSDVSDDAADWVCCGSFNGKLHW